MTIESDSTQGGFSQGKTHYARVRLLITAPSLNHWVQPDTIIPNPSNPQSWNRYAYVRGNPVKYNDPSGHIAACPQGMQSNECSNGQKVASLTSASRTKLVIWQDFGIKMSDKGDKAWDNHNLNTMYSSLKNIDNAISGKLKSFAQGWTFRWQAKESGYYGLTSTDGTMTVDFFTDKRGVVQQNIYHEVGHVFDNIPGMEHFFSRRPGINNADFLDDYGKLDINALIDKVTPDMYQHSASVFTDDVSEKLYAQAEHWADMFANYVAGNIDLDSPEGRAMNAFVVDALRP